VVSFFLKQRYLIDCVQCVIGMEVLRYGSVGRRSNVAIVLAFI